MRPAAVTASTPSSVKSIVLASHDGIASGWSAAGSSATAIENSAYQDRPTMSARWPATS
jgi:hypothetical protein